MLGAHNRTRTGDLILTKNVLYLLSYVGSQWAGQDSNLRRLPPAGLQPAPFAARDTDPGGLNIAILPNRGCFRKLHKVKNAMLEPTKGLEPITGGLQNRCSAN